MAVVKCPQCSKTFASENKLSIRRKEKHINHALVTCYDNTEICLICCNGYFRCLCDDDISFETSNGFSKHVLNKKCQDIETILFSKFTYVYR